MLNLKEKTLIEDILKTVDDDITIILQLNWDTNSKAQIEFHRNYYIKFGILKTLNVLGYIYDNNTKTLKHTGELK